MSFGPLEIAIIAIVIFALFGYKKLPDATRAVGRSLRIFKGEMKGMNEDSVETKAEAQTVRGEIVNPAPQPQATTPPAAAPVAETPAPAAAPAPAPAPQQAPRSDTTQSA